jgi:alkaline phosphatase D
MNYRAWGFTQEDNFCRLDLDKRAHSLKVRVFDRNGKPVETANEQGKKVKANLLPLAAWD